MWITFIKPYVRDGVEIFGKNDDALLEKRSAYKMIKEGYAEKSKW